MMRVMVVLVMVVMGRGRGRGRGRTIPAIVGKAAPPRFFVAGMRRWRRMVGMMGDVRWRWRLKRPVIVMRRWRMSLRRWCARTLPSAPSWMTLLRLRLLMVEVVEVVGVVGVCVGEAAAWPRDRPRLHD